MIKDNTKQSKSRMESLLDTNLNNDQLKKNVFKENLSETFTWGCTKSG